MSKQKPSQTKAKLEWGKIVVPATLGFIGVLATAVCGCISTVIVAWMTSRPSATNPPQILVMPTNPPVVATATRQPIIPTPTKDLPTINYEAHYSDVFSSTHMAVYGKIQGDTYIGISPVECKNFYIGNSTTPNSVERQNEVQMSYKFIVLSDKPIIVSDISLHKDKYSPPPSTIDLTEALYVWGRGGEEVVSFDLSNATIGENFQQASLDDGKAYRLEENDAVSFSTNLFFVQPGDYKLHVELKVETYDGDSFAYKSEPISFSWLYLNNIESLKIVDFIYGEKVIVDSSPCTE